MAAANRRCPFCAFFRTLCNRCARFLVLRAGGEPGEKHHAATNSPRFQPREPVSSGQSEPRTAGSIGIRQLGRAVIARAAHLCVVCGVAALLGGTVPLAATPAITLAGSSGEIGETSSMTFLTPALGWRVSNRWDPNRGAYGPTTISRTVDGGSQWRTVSSFAGLPTFQVFFANPRDGWLYGSRLYATHDAGRTWRRISLGASTTVLGVVGPDPHIMRLDSTCTRSSGNCRLTLYRSTAGSDMWHLMPQPPIAFGINTALVRAGPDDAWIAGNATARSKNPHMALIATTNGGRTWQRRVMPCTDAGIGSNFAELVPYTATSVWMFCASQPSAGSQTKAVFRSANGGRSWHLMSRSESFGTIAGAVGTVPGTGYLDNAAVTSPAICWLALGRGTLFGTTDGGRTWRLVINGAVANPGGGGVGPVLFVDPDHGWLRSWPNILFRTTDGGRRWQTIHLN